MLMQLYALQLLLILLDEPNVLILDEPTNDLDTDMLAAMEDVLDSWAGCLIVVSHDRYLIERVTDHQYAIFDGRLQHVPGGVDAYLAMSGKGSVGKASSADAKGDAQAAPAGLSGAERRALEKEAASLDRRLTKATSQRKGVLDRFEVVDHSDLGALSALQAELAEVDDRIAVLEEQWLETHEGLEA